MLTDDDLAIFKQAMQGVTPLPTANRAYLNHQLAFKSAQFSAKRLNAVTNIQSYQDGFSDQFAEEVKPNEELYFVRSGVQSNQINKLKAGKIHYSSSIDLHGFTIEKARNALSNFLTSAIANNWRVIHIIHGKAAKYQQSATLKSYVNSWLKGHKQVLAFCSCIAKHGGTGAIYVMLRRNRII